jgi:hypothetical protein
MPRAQMQLLLVFIKKHYTYVVHFPFHGVEIFVKLYQGVPSTTFLKAFGVEEKILVNILKAPCAQCYQLNCFCVLSKMGGT